MRIDSENKLHCPYFHENIPYSIGDTIYPSVRISDYEGMDKLNAFTYGVINAYNNIDSAKNHANISRNYVVVKCIIPKNTVYWENTNEIACMKLKLKEIVET